ncbi:MAG: polysaccharide biosynthesis C-terminal domain-containing protein [Chlorobi bacterium]|nr:polysaccharide biosynthesis C-terminal domain-containing protein [Chlorobiota bacterium]
MLDKIKSLSKQTLIYGTSTIIGRFLNFILVPFYTNVFPPSEYGIIAVVFAYIAFFNIIYAFGFEAGYFRFASSVEIGDEKQNFSHPFFTILINSAFFSAIILLFSGTFSEVAGIKDSSFIIYSAFILFFDALSLVPFAYLRLKNKAMLFATIKLLNIVINVSLNLLLILVFNFGLVAVFISNLAASLVTFLVLSPVVFRNLSLKFNRELFKELWKFSVPYLPAALASMVVQVLSVLIVRYLTNEQTVGIFNANYKLGIFMMLVVSMFEYAWRPFFLNNAGDPGAKPLFAKILTLFVGSASLIFVLLSFTIEDIVRIPLPYKGYIIGQKYWGGVVIVPIILLAYLFLGIYTNLIAGIYIEKKTKYLPFITGLGAVLNIAACFTLIPLWGIAGAALSTLISYIAMAVYMYVVVQKFYPVEYEFSKVLSLIVIDILAIAVFFLSFGSLDLLYRTILALVLSAVIIYISGLYKAKLLLPNQ